MVCVLAAIAAEQVADALALGAPDGALTVLTVLTANCTLCHLLTREDVMCRALGGAALHRAQHCYGVRVGALHEGF